MPPELGVVANGQYFVDLDYADDVPCSLWTIPSDSYIHVLNMLEEMSETVGIHQSWSKTKIQHLGAGPSETTVTMNLEVSL